MSQYDAMFYDFIRPGSLRSADIIIPILVDIGIKPRSVADVGCGEGVWLSRWKELTGARVHGFDGDYVGDENLRIDPAEFTATDLSQASASLDGFRFDLAQSLEVAEHLPEEAADNFVSLMVGLSDVILWSAAVPGQIGRGHINEQWPEYWDEKFQSHGYVGSNYIRDQIWDNPDVENWYKQNTILYVKDSSFALEALPHLFQEPITWRIHPNNPHILPPGEQND
jgi:hypothetical protein